MKIEKIERCVDWHPWGITYETGDREYRVGCNAIVIYAFRHRIEFQFREFVQPHRVWVDLSRYEWATSPEKGYWDISRREWGFQLNEGFLQVFFGPQTNDSSSTKSWSKFLPWTQWRHVRMSYYGVEGEHLRTWRDGRGPHGSSFDERYAFQQEMPKRVFRFRDYDGEVIEASTHIEEREWRFGKGWFKWLSLFRRPKVKRSLDIEFSKEVGPRKGSWKGGTMGHSIEMLPYELHPAAFERYAREHNFSDVEMV